MSAEGGKASVGSTRSWDDAYIAHVLRPGFEHWQRHYWDFFFDLERAHLVALVRAGWLNRADAARIAAGLVRLQSGNLRTEPYRSDVEDLFFAVEQRLREEVGEIADNLHLARSRNDIDVTLYRLDLRRALLEAHERLGALSEALLALAWRHIRTVMPGYTHGQQAQPTTLAHYLAAVLSNVERSRRRLEAHYPWSTSARWGPQPSRPAPSPSTAACWRSCWASTMWCAILTTLWPRPTT